jgi:hypothetical protein
MQGSSARCLAVTLPLTAAGCMCWTWELALAYCL